MFVRYCSYVSCYAVLYTNNIMPIKLTQSAFSATFCNMCSLKFLQFILIYVLSTIIMLVWLSIKCNLTKISKQNRLSEIRNTNPRNRNHLLVLHQSELIGQCQATPHHLSDVRRGAPSWIWDYFLQSDVTICVLNAIYICLSSWRPSGPAAWRRQLS